jgi:hypothetical protein
MGLECGFFTMSETSHLFMGNYGIFMVNRDIWDIYGIFMGFMFIEL